MMTGWPIVTRLKYARSAGRRQGRALSRPMTRLRAMATTSDRITASNRDRRLDRRVRVVSLEAEVVEGEREEVLHRRVEVHHGKRARRARELLARLLEVVEVEVRVAQRVHEIARLEARHLRDHHREQRVGGDVEGHAEEDVRAPLVELAGELAVGHVELEERVARGERHARD